MLGQSRPPGADYALLLLVTALWGQRCALLPRRACGLWLNNGGARFLGRVGRRAPAGAGAVA